MTMQTQVQRTIAALKNAFIADALAMPVHWYYNPGDILKQFPRGVHQYEDAPKFHPSSIMSLHSTQHGGRSKAVTQHQKEIVGDVILKGKREYWGIANQHYHQGMKAGENTLNAYCARVLLVCLGNNHGKYERDDFLEAYIELLTAKDARHPDTYAESYHRGFFANLEAGKAAYQCGAVTHDTASIGGLVTIGPLALVSMLHGMTLQQAQVLCRKHLQLTHPDEELAKVSDVYVELLNRLLVRAEDDPTTILADIAAKGSGLNLPELAAKNRSDMEVVGGRFSSACYISGAWPSVLYFAYKYAKNPKKALIANTNVGGDNVHRGFVLGGILGLMNGSAVDGMFAQLRQATELETEINKACTVHQSAKFI